MVGYRGKVDQCTLSGLFFVSLVHLLMSVAKQGHLKGVQLIQSIALVAEWLRVRLRVRMVRGSTLTVGNFLSLENLNVIIRAIN